MSDRWSDDVAAYALGALGGRERAELEEHLASCAECRAAADDAAWTVRALDRVPPSAVGGLAGTGREGHRRRDDGDASGGPGEGSGADDGPPSTILLALLDAARRERRARSRRTAVGLGAVAAAVAAGVGVATGTLPGPWAERATVVEARGAVVRLEPVGGTGVEGWVRVEDVSWGTRLEVTCRYPDGPTPGDAGAYGYGADAAPSYALVVRTADGSTVEVATWRAGGGEHVVPASTAVRVDQIVGVELRSGDGTVLLSAPV